MDYEIPAQEKSRIWWKGALKGALRGVPQGLLLGTLGFAVLVGGLYAFGATALVGSFGTFLFSDAVAASDAITAGNFGGFLSALGPAPFILLNTVLTSVGNFITGGDIAVAAHKQDIEHSMNEARIERIESREIALEQDIVATPSRVARKIIAAGPRHSGSFREAAEAREQQPLPVAPTIH